MKAATAANLVLAAVMVFAPAARGQGVGFAQQAFPAGTTPRGVAAGDFNGDGNLDLAAANNMDNTVSIFLGDGKGGFSAKVDYPSAAGPVAVAVGDFNGDGKLDLAVACQGANVVSVLLGYGNGTFAAKADFATGNSPKGVAAGDFSGDGKLDLTTANSAADTVSVLLGQGNGTFSAPTDYPTGAQPNAILVDDLNGDGKADLATANVGAGTVSVLLGNGNGTFAAKADFLTDVGPLALASADFRNQLKRDLVTVNNRSTASLLLGKGNGTFNPHTDLGVDTGPIAVTAADFNADGKMDFVAASGYFYYGYGPFGYVSLRNGDGQGGFSAFRFPTTGFVPGGMAQGDFNGDGRVDLAVTDATHNQVVIFLQAPAFSRASLAFGPQFTGTTSGNATVTFTNAGGVALSFTSIALGGANGSEFALVADPTACTANGGSLPPSGSCNLIVTFTPSAAGNRSATVSITDNATGSPHVLTVSGVGVTAFTLVPFAGQSNSQTIKAGGTAAFNFNLSNPSGAAGTVNFTCSGAPTAASCKVVPDSVSGPNANQPIQLSVVTTAPSLLPPGGRLPMPAPGLGARMAALALLLVLLLPVLYGLTRGAPGSGYGKCQARPAGWVVVVLALLMAGLAAACGTNSVGGMNGGTPKGTYPIKVTGRAGTVSQSIEFTVLVK